MHDRSPGRWLARIGWLVVFWIAGVAALAVVAWLVKLGMNAAGMSVR
ncbi:MAG TPA: DUF2474 family protein [Burkholderiales bacterium]|nr:DUF2474 family protein [Betaproteobacteria bacterium]HQR52128.1 DUF2474 family protein [Burkholderiales bacterium]